MNMPFKVGWHRLVKPVAAVLLGMFFSLPVVYGAGESEAPTIKDLLQNKTKQQAPVTQAPAAHAPVEEAGPQDKYKRTTPRGSIQGLGDALDDRDYELALEYMDLRNLPKNISRQNTELARELKIIMDRSSWIDPYSVSDAPLGYRDDDLKPYLDLLASLETPAGTVDLFMQRIPDSKGGFVWKLSNRSIAKIPVLYQHHGYGEIGDKLSRMFPEYEFLGLVVWQWVMLLGIVLVSFVIAWVITWLINLILRARKVVGYDQYRSFIAGPVRFLLLVMIIRVMFESIAPSTMARAIFEAKTLPIIAIVWLLTGFIKLVFIRMGERMKRAGNQHAIRLLRPATTLTNVIILLIALLSWLDNMGFSVTALLTGLGVGGIAVGLAAQKSIENLIGAVTLLVSQPVTIGDFCRAGNTLGVVEEIGLRATMLRTLDRTIVSIPNAVFANMDIENLTSRDRILYRRRIRLRNDATPDQVRVILENVRNMFLEHKAVNPDPARIRFIEYGEYALELEAFAYINTCDFNEYLGTVEDLNLRIMDIIEAAGSQLAVPARVVQMEQQEAVPAT
jgi:MscS family membrane protein